MILDMTFVLFAGLIVLALIPLYIYREKVFPFIYKDNNTFDLFVRDLQVHMKKEHPVINFDYSIIEKTKDEKNIRLRETLIVEDIVAQFFNYKYTKRTQSLISKENLWTGYDEKSKSSTKLPSDWKQRKELAWRRDNQRCNRCKTVCSLDNSFTNFAKDIEKGGGYNFENIITLCSDCNRILNSTNQKRTISSLNLNDTLMRFVSN